MIMVVCIGVVYMLDVSLLYGVMFKISGILVWLLVQYAFDNCVDQLCSYVISFSTSIKMSTKENNNDENNDDNDPKLDYTLDKYKLGS